MFRINCLGVILLEGVVKVIEELGLMILAKEVELRDKQHEIKELKKKIEIIEGHLEVYDEYYNKGA
jgi:hypothetical protein